MRYRDRNMEVCNENRTIVRNNGYHVNGHDITLNHPLSEHQRVEVYSPGRVEECVRQYEKTTGFRHSAGNNKISVENTDSFGIQTDMVMNFANARHSGGGYLTGANAQEEALCRQSTLYASINSREANQMYAANQNVRDFDTDYLLVSPCVEVFRNRDLSFRERPFTTSVVTMAAPNRMGRARDISDDRLREYYRHRIRQMLCVAVSRKIHTITLGAWGCGAFRNDPREVAAAFKYVLVDEGLADAFEAVVFAIPKAHNPCHDNHERFKKIFEV